MYELKLDHEKKVVYRTHTGDISMEEMQSVWAELLAIDEFANKDYDLIVDFGRSKFTFPFSDRGIIYDFIEENKNLFKTKKLLFISEDVVATGFMMFVINMSKRISGADVKFFYSVREAEKYLEVHR
jgi:hypothetical protein